MKDKLTNLNVRTRHPETYILFNEDDGTRWRGTAEGLWVRQPDNIDWNRVDDELLHIFTEGENDLERISGVQVLMRKVCGP